VLEDSREKMAAILGASPEEVIFTSGGTEAINQALFSLAAGRTGTVATTAGEHPATLEAIGVLQKRGWRRHVLALDGAGWITRSSIDDAPWDEIQLATVILAHNEVGVVQDVSHLAGVCSEHGVPLHLDAVQAVGKVAIDFHAVGATALALGAHKFHGPRGVGALLVKKGTTLPPLLYGGHQERGRRPGTEPVALIAGMATALDVWHRSMAKRTDLLMQLRNRLQDGLSERCRPVIVNGSSTHRLPNTLNIAFPGCDGDALLVNLDLEGVCCSIGSACSSGSSEPAPVLVAMGCPPEVYKSSLRFSVSILNTTAEIDLAIDKVARVVERLRAHF
jgi:cysteine desulfurase